MERCILWLTSKMSHDHGWRAACLVTSWILGFHFGVGEGARGVTAMVVGSGDLFGYCRKGFISEVNLKYVL